MIIGKGGAFAMGTLVERSTRFVKLLHLPEGASAERNKEAMRGRIRPWGSEGDITLPGQRVLGYTPSPWPSRSTFRGAGSGGDPPGPARPRLTIRPSLLTLALLAPLTAGAGVGNRLSPIDDGPDGAKSAPPGINQKGETAMTTIATTTVAGNLTRDPEIRYTRDGQATTSLSVAVNRRWQDKDTKEWEESTSFLDVVCWRDLAENVALSLTKGAGS